MKTIVILTLIGFLNSCSQAPGELDLALSTSSSSENCYSLKGSHLSTASDLSYITLPSGFDLTGFNSTGVTFSNINVSNTKGLSVQMLNNANSTLRDIILPAGFDMTGFNASGKKLINIDLSNTTNLNPTSFNGATELENITLPPNYNLTGLVTTGMVLEEMDFSNTSGLTIQMLNDATLSGDIKLPDGFDVTGLDLTGAIISTDFTNTVGLTIGILDNATYFGGKIPAGLDISSLDYANAETGTLDFPNQKYLGVDFSQTTGINFDIYMALARCTVYWIGMTSTRITSSCNTLPPLDVSAENFSGVSLYNMNLKSLVNFDGGHIQQSNEGLRNVIVPDGLDFTGYTGKEYIENVDLTTAINFTSTMFNNTSDLNNNTFPVMDFSGVNIWSTRWKNANLKNVTGLTAAQIHTPYVNPLVFPDGFDISGVDFSKTGSKADGVDFTNTTGMVVSQIENIISIPALPGIIFPAVDVSTLDTTGKPVWRHDFSNTINFDVSMINAALSWIDSPIPDGTDLTGLNRPDMGSSNFSNGVNLPATEINKLAITHIPAGSDFSLYDPMTAESGTYKNVFGSTLYSEIPIFPVAQVNTFSKIDGLTLPSGYNLASFDPSGMSLVRKLNAKEATNFPISALDKGVDFKEFTPPDGLDISSWNSTGKTITGWDLSQVKGLNVNHFKNASNITGIKVPSDFDFTGVDFNSKSLYGANFANLVKTSCD